MFRNSMPDLSFLKKILAYCPATGVFTWKCKISDKIIVGKRAGCLQKLNGYWIIRINKINYMAHRLAYYYMTGININHLDIDHINGNKSDCRFQNLRLATKNQNEHNRPKRINNKSGFKGVSLHKSGNYRARICVNKKNIMLGYYKTPFYAALVYARAAKKYHKDFYKI